MNNNEFKTSNFYEDAEKMRDFKKLSKMEFLQSYSYLTEEEYENTKEIYEDNLRKKHDNMSNKYQIKITREITEEEITDIIIDGLESGITYWALLYNDSPIFDNFYKVYPDDATSEICAKIILSGGVVEIGDMEDETQKKYPLTFSSLIKGIQMACDNNSRFDFDNLDAEDCDCIFQYALFNEIIFG